MNFYIEKEFTKIVSNVSEAKLQYYKKLNLYP